MEVVQGVTGSPCSCKCHMPHTMVWSSPELQGYLLGLPCLSGGVVSGDMLDWRSHVFHLNHMVILSYPPSLTPVPSCPRLFQWTMWILAKPFTCWSNTNSGPLHSWIHGLALHLKGSSSMNSPRNTDLRPQSKLWTWKWETSALQIKLLPVKKSVRSSVGAPKGTFIFFHGGTSPGVIVLE